MPDSDKDHKEIQNRIMEQRMEGQFFTQGGQGMLL